MWERKKFIKGRENQKLIKLRENERKPSFRRNLGQMEKCENTRLRNLRVKENKIQKLREKERNLKFGRGQKIERTQN